MFERPHHQRIAQVLERLDSELLLKSRCLFGGGTALSLANGEYRESVDIDFICSSVEGYRTLRGLVSDAGIDTLLTLPLPCLREPRIDQYGIRCAFSIDGQPIKFEIVFEGRISLDDPLPEDRICGIWTLASDDRIATKLMANSDRWADDSNMSRDLIDLAMIVPNGEIPQAGLSKALHAYGASVTRDLAKSKTALLERRGRLNACMRAMGMTFEAKALRSRIERLSSRP